MIHLHFMVYQAYLRVFFMSLRVLISLWLNKEVNEEG
jgi:hypothetical protein